MNSKADMYADHQSEVKFYCNNIMKNKKAGIYNGAYNVVKIAVSRKKELRNRDEQPA